MTTALTSPLSSLNTVILFWSLQNKTAEQQHESSQIIRGKTLQLGLRKTNLGLQFFDILNILPMLQNIEILVLKAHDKIHRTNKIELQSSNHIKLSIRATFIKEVHIFIKTKLIHSLKNRLVYKTKTKKINNDSAGFTFQKYRHTVKMQLAINR